MTATRVCALSELEQDSALRVEVDGVAICVVKDSSDEIHAIGDVCTHGDISLAEGFVDGDTIECWAHGSAFSLLSGQAPQSPRVRARSRLRRHHRRRRCAHRSRVKKQL